MVRYLMEITPEEQKRLLIELWSRGQARGFLGHGR